MDWEQILEEAGLKPHELVVEENEVLAYYQSKGKAMKAQAVLDSKGVKNPETFKSVDGRWIASGEF